MKRLFLFLLVSLALNLTSLFATIPNTNSCKNKCQKTVVKETVGARKSVLELAKRAAQISSSQKNVFPEFMIGNTFIKL